jgi:hypothetical protein
VPGVVTRSLIASKHRRIAITRDMCEPNEGKYTIELCQPGGVRIGVEGIIASADDLTTARKLYRAAAHSNPGRVVLSDTVVKSSPAATAPMTCRNDRAHCGHGPRRARRRARDSRFPTIPLVVCPDLAALRMGNRGGP